MSREEIIRAIIEQVTGSVSRSTALKPLAWLIGILVVGTAGLGYSDSESDVFYGFFVLLVVSVAIYLIAFSYLLITNVDALRSERYSLEKLAIEKGVYGDNLIGKVDPRTIPQEIDQGQSEEK